MTLCKTPELACEVTLQPIQRFRLDAAILFSDILTIPDAMGLGLTFLEGEGPHFERPIRSALEIERLGVPDPEAELRYVPEAIRLIKRSLDPDVPLIGFSGSPWTLATYMVEGGSSRDFRRVKGLLYDAPGSMHALLSKLTAAVSQYVNAQIAAGADAIMLFDTWGGMLTEAQYREFSLAYSAAVLSQLLRHSAVRPVPVILFTKGGGQWLEAMAAAGFDALGLDWTTGIGDARRRVGSCVALQGNLDPVALYASTDVIRKEVGKILESYGFGSGHVFNLGHGILPDVDPDHVGAMVEAVRELSPKFHSKDAAL